nr:translation initiation factor IF-2-like [Lytechinus pictus]
MRSLITVLAVCLLTGESLAVTCPAGWATFGYSCYKYVAERMSWIDAHRRCNQVRENGPDGRMYMADLVSIENPMEDKFVYNWLYKTGGSLNKVWTGLVERYQNQYVWIDRTPVRYTNWKQDQPQLNWHRQAAHIFNGRELQTWVTSNWKTPMSFVCKLRFGPPYGGPGMGNPSGNPNQPSGPNRPTRPLYPNRPNTPIVPNGANPPMRPNRPVNPNQPNRPMNPNQPNRPVNPNQPNWPVNPNRPMNPNQPNRPMYPNQPVNPNQPNRPFNPNQPNQPVNPNQPNRPVQPDESESTKPTRESKPTVR